MEFILKHQVVLAPIIAAVIYAMVVLFVKVVPKEQLYKLGTPVVKTIAIILNTFLLRFFPKSKAEDIEKTFFNSLGYCIKKWIDLFLETLKQDNTKKEKKK